MVQLYNNNEYKVQFLFLITIPQANVYLPGAKEKAIFFCSETSRIVVEYSEWFVGLTHTGSTHAYKMALEATQSAKFTTQAVIE